MVEIVRLADWQSRLQNYLVDQAFGQQKDCAQFVTGAIRAMTDVDLAGQFGEYESLADGIRLLKKAGYKDHVDFIAKHFEQIPPSFAQPGDLAFVQGDIDNAGGVVQGGRIYVIRPDGKFGTVPLREAKMAFRLPYAKAVK